MNADRSPLVLLAEDDDALRVLLHARLEREGMKVVDVEDGLELRDYLTLCRPGGDLGRPDVVISDVNMPGETGPEAMERSEFFNSPVVLISACPGQQLRTLGARLGVSAIFEKPFDLDSLMVAVHRAVGQGQVVPVVE
jgi:CheY-like chemotaxis protein